MGAAYITAELKANKDTYKRKFLDLVENEAYLYGHGGYSGTFAEKHQIKIVQPPPGQQFWNRDDADEYASEEAEKWGPALGFWLDENTLFVGAWASM